MGSLGAVTGCHRTRFVIGMLGVAHLVLSTSTEED